MTIRLLGKDMGSGATWLVYLIIHFCWSQLVENSIYPPSCLPLILHFGQLQSRVLCCCWRVGRDHQSKCQLEAERAAALGANTAFITDVAPFSIYSTGFAGGRLKSGLRMMFQLGEGDADQWSLKGRYIRD